jgi:hypothetical protein
MSQAAISMSGKDMNFPGKDIWTLRGDRPIFRNS